MSTMQLNISRAMANAERTAIKQLTAITEVGKDVFAAATPVDTERGRKSVHRKVIDSKGNFANGDVSDGNGNATPDYQGFLGMVVGIVATNEAAANGGEYYLHYVNRGVQGRSGVLMKEQARAAMDAERKRQ